MLFLRWVVLPVLISCLYIPQLYAATRTWDNGSGDGKWSSCQNWSNNQCPDSDDTARFNSTSTANATIDSSTTVKKIDIRNTYTGTISSDSGVAVTVDDEFSQDGGTFTAPSGTMTVNGNFSRSAGTFSHNSGTLVLGGSNQTLSGTTTFNHLTKTVSTAATLTLPASTTTTIVGTLILQGASGQRLSLRSNPSSSQANLDPQGIRTLKFLDVKDINNTNTTVANCFTSCVNTGNNTNWDFNANIQFSASSSSGSEASTPASLTLSLEEAIGVDATVGYTVTGTATGAGTDYTLANGTATVSANTSSTTMSIPIVNDSLDENDETIIVTLSNPTNSELGSTTVHTYTITDNDDPPTLAIDDIAVAETEGNVTATFTVTLSTASAKAITVDYATANVTASSGSDYTASSGTLIFAAGDSAKTVSVTVLGDSLDEDNETFSVSLSNASNASIADSSGTGTITDNDAAPSISFASASSSASESTSSTNFTVSLSAVSSKTIAVNYAVTGGTATGSGTDYTLANASLTFNAGESSKTISVSIAADTLDEEDETLIVTLANPVNASLGSGTTHTLTIADDDAAPSISVNDVTVTETESNVTATFTVTLSVASAKAITVDYATANGTASSGSDYTASSGTLSFAAGNSSKTISVTVLGDSLDENNETFTVSLSNASNASIADKSGTATITDNDEPETDDDKPEEEDTEEAEEEPDEEPEEEIEEEPEAATPVTANAGGDRSITTGGRVILTGQATGDELSYAWSILSGQGTLSDAQTLTPTYTAPPEAGTTIIQLAVIDPTGQNANDTLTIQIIDTTQIKTEALSKAVVGFYGSENPVALYEDIADDGSAVLVIEGFSEIELPDEGCESYTLAMSRNLQIAIACLGSTDNQGQVFFAKTSISDLSETIDLNVSAFSSSTARTVTSDVSDSDQDGDASPPSSDSAADTSEFAAIVGNQTGDEFGKFMAVGDIDQDGADEFLIAAPGAGDHGVVYVYDEDIVLTAIIFGSEMNPIASVLTNHYLSGDDGDDIFFGPYNLALNNTLQFTPFLSQAETSEQPFFLAGDSDFEDSIDLNLTEADATMANDRFYTAAAFGDLNHDGVQDLVVATDEGNIAVYFGPIADDTALNTADVVIASDEANSAFGQMLAIGDTSGDGIADLVIGAPGHSDPELLLNGLIYVILGAESWSSSLSLADNSQALRIPGSISNEQIGSDLILADTNADGIQEIFTTASTGQAYRTTLTSSGADNRESPPDEPTPSFEGAYLTGGCSLSGYGLTIGF